jgi:hypothetical protein
MKLISALAATLILGTSAALAQTSATAPANAAPAASAPASSSSASSSTSASATKSQAAACHKQAVAKNLSGAEKTQFMKDCKAGKSSS